MYVHEATSDNEKMSTKFKYIWKHKETWTLLQNKWKPNIPHFNNYDKTENDARLLYREAYSGSNDDSNHHLVLATMVLRVARNENKTFCRKRNMEDFRRTENYVWKEFKRQLNKLDKWWSIEGMD